MAIRFRSASTQIGNGAGNILINKPTGVVEGDALIAVIALDLSAGVSAPSGWTQVINTELSVLEQFVFVKIAGAAEGSSYTFNHDRGADRAVAVMLAYSGVDPDDPIDVSGARKETGSSSTIVAPSVTTTWRDSVVIAAGCIARPNTSVSTPSGTTSRGAAATSIIAASLHVVDFSQATAGATGSKSFVAGGSGQSIGQQIALRQANQAPNAATGLSPNSADTIDQTKTRRFSWTFSDDDPGDSQSQFDLQIRPLGSAVNTVDVSSETPNSYYDVASGTLAEGDHEWRVRTYDAEGLVGPWTTWEPFTAASPPAGPTITDPIAGSTISAETYVVQWSAAEQDDYQLRRVADDGSGVPDTTTVYFDTGTVTSSSTRSLEVDFETNGRTEHVQLRVRRDGLWSAWATVDVAVDYTVPATPTVTVDDTTVDGAIRVQAAHPAPSGDEPTVEQVDIWRRDSDSEIRVAAGLAPTAVFEDWAVASGRAYDYAVRAHGDNGTSAWSDWSGESTVVPGYYGGGYE